jgi:hypothetical protein
MYQHNGKQRYTEGNRGQHEMCPEQVKGLLPGTQQSFAHNPKVAGSIPAPATDGNARKHWVSGLFPFSELMDVTGLIYRHAIARSLEVDVDLRVHGSGFGLGAGRRLPAPVTTSSAK